MAALSIRAYSTVDDRRESRRILKEHGVIPCGKDNH
jgi:hypothetical protein